jgi:hypothetical protein
VPLDEEIDLFALFNVPESAADSTVPVFQPGDVVRCCHYTSPQFAQLRVHAVRDKDLLVCASPGECTEGERQFWVVATDCRKVSQLELELGENQKRKEEEAMARIVKVEKPVYEDPSDGQHLAVIYKITDLGLAKKKNSPDDAEVQMVKFHYLLDQIGKNGRNLAISESLALVLNKWLLARCRAIGYEPEGTELDLDLFLDIPLFIDTKVDTDDKGRTWANIKKVSPAPAGTEFPAPEWLIEARHRRMQAREEQSELAARERFSQPTNGHATLTQELETAGGESDEPWPTDEDMPPETTDENTPF